MALTLVAVPSRLQAFLISAGTDAKSILLSRTLWVNIAMLGALLASAPAGLLPVAAPVIGAIGAISNIGLRLLTNQAVTLSWPQPAKALPPVTALTMRPSVPPASWAGAGTGLMLVSVRGEAAQAFLDPTHALFAGANPPSAPEAPAPTPIAPATADAPPVPVSDAEAAPIIRRTPMDLGYIFTLAEVAPGVLSAGNTLYAEYKSGKLTEDNVLDAFKVLNQTFGELFKESPKVQGVVTQVSAAIAAAEQAEAAAKPAG